MPLLVATLPTPIGPVEVVTKGGVLCAVAFEGHEESTHAWMERRFGGLELERHETLGEATDRLAAYFAGDVKAIDLLPVDTGGTTFQRRVWETLRKIPPGTTQSYGEVARAIWHEKAARAVGMAVGHNPVPIVVPCHRVVAANGKLGGFTGGIDRKRWLLAHEEGQRSILG